MLNGNIIEIDFCFKIKLQNKNIDWKWLENQNQLYSSNYVNVIKLNKPLMVKIDGINGKGVIIKSDINIDSMDENESTGI